MGKNKYLTRDEILAAPDLKIEEIPVPEWGGVVRVMELSGYRRDLMDAQTFRETRDNPESGLENFRAKLVAFSIVDENGDPLFTAGDVQALGRKSSVALKRVYDAAKRLSMLAEEDVEAFSENLASTPGDVSTSD